MTRVIKKIAGDFIAKVYISVIKPAINSYSNKTQLENSVLGSQVNFYGCGTVFNGEHLKVGDYSRIGENFFFHCGGGIEIGKNTILSRDVTIYSTNHNYKSEDLIPYGEDYLHQKVVIGNHVWIGMGVKILPGVTIGDGAIIGMGAIISKDVAELSIVVNGGGQRVVGERDEFLFKQNVKQKQFYGRKNSL